jgi:hypothetical protein
VLGIIVIGLIGTQALGALLLRPRPGARLRGAWNLWHHNWGRLALSAALANLFIGCVLYAHGLALPGQQTKVLVAWVAPCGGVLCLALLVDVVLTVYVRRWRKYSVAVPSSIEEAVVSEEGMKAELANLEAVQRPAGSNPDCGSGSSGSDPVKGSTTGAGMAAVHIDGMHPPSDEGSSSPEAGPSQSNSVTGAAAAPTLNPLRVQVREGAGAAAAAAGAAVAAAQQGSHVTPAQVDDSRSRSLLSRW